MKNDKKSTSVIDGGKMVKRGLNPRPSGKKPNYVPPAQKKTSSTSEKKD